MAAINFKYFGNIEKSKVDVLLTTDDRLLRKAVQNKDVLNVRVRNPIKWLIEMI